MSNYFARERDKRDRKRRFLRGLNAILGRRYGHLEDKDILMIDAIRFMERNNPRKSSFRNAMANVYGLEFTPEEIVELLNSDMTTGEFTQKYVAVIYKSRGRTDLNTLVRSSMRNVGGVPAIDLSEIDKSPKYGLNGTQWCDVAEGPCSCGAWHK